MLAEEAAGPLGVAGELFFGCRTPSTIARRYAALLDRVYALAAAALGH